RLRMSGSMGMSGAVAGVIDIRLTPQGTSTVLRLSHRAVGEVTEETRTGYRDGWKVLLTERLKAYVERGVRSGLKR
ncbi:MAG TPA: SRPBCC domain-containing protein, partial [bacterium]